jgi:hypothetical protein
MRLARFAAPVFRALLAWPLDVQAQQRGRVRRSEVPAHRRRLSFAATICTLFGLLSGCAGTVAGSPPWAGTYEGVAYAYNQTTGLTLVLRPSGEQVMGRWTTGDGHAGTLIAIETGPGTLTLQGRQDQPTVRQNLSGLVTYGETTQGYILTGRFDYWACTSCENSGARTATGISTGSRRPSDSGVRWGQARLGEYRWIWLSGRACEHSGSCPAERRPF